MVIPPEGTFEYVAEVPDHAGVTFSCDASSRLLGNEGHGSRSRLVGPTPRLHVEDAGPTPNPGPRSPATQRSRLRLTASERRNATVAETSFILDQGVISALRPRDLLHMVRTGCGGIGVSAIRSDQLIFAVGAITQVPLGSDFEARIPSDLVCEAEDIFRRRDRRFEFAEYPVEIRASNAAHIMYRGRIELVCFNVWVLHGRYYGVPGTEECLSVARKGACPVVDVNSSALFLDSSNLGLDQW
jgi:hypothetical protein